MKCANKDGRGGNCAGTLVIMNETKVFCPTCKLTISGSPAKSYVEKIRAQQTTQVTRMSDSPVVHLAAEVWPR